MRTAGLRQYLVHEAQIRFSSGLAAQHWTILSRTLHSLFLHLSWPSLLHLDHFPIVLKRIAFPEILHRRAKD